MIQRIQTVYLTLTTILSVLFLVMERTVFITAVKGLTPAHDKGLSETTAVEVSSMKDWLLIIVISILLLSALLSLITIFYYRKRRIQMKLASAVITGVILATVMYILYLFLLSGKNMSTGISVINLTLIVLTLLSAVLAYRGIKKDEELVRSYDRLR